MLRAFLGHLLRFLSLCAFAFWQGGFVFYAGVVVPLAGELWGHRTQGFLTRQVVPWIHLAALAALGLWLLDAALLKPRRKSRFLLTLAMSLGVLLLIWLYPQMDAHLDPEINHVEEPRQFRLLHRIYLWTSTVTWMASLAWLWLLTAQDDPRKENEGDPENEKSRRNRDTGQPAA